MEYGSNTDFGILPPRRRDREILENLRQRQPKFFSLFVVVGVRKLRPLVATGGLVTAVQLKSGLLTAPADAFLALEKHVNLQRIFAFQHTYFAGKFIYSHQSALKTEIFR